MMALWKTILKKKTTWLLLFVLPAALWLFVFPAAEETASQVNVPITIVDEQNQAITDELLSESEQRPFQVTRTDELDLEPLLKGETEAILVFHDQMEERISTGDMDEMITWYRNENSYVDGLFKEKLAAAIMSRAVRAEAANLVSGYEPDADWEEVYQYGTRYFEPEPIFQMEFETIGAEPMEAVESGDQIVFVLIWLYVWLIIGYLTLFLYQWREAGTVERMRLIRARGKLYALWLLFVFMMSALFFILSLLVMELPINHWVFLILLASILFYLFVSIIFRKKEALYTIAIIYGLASFIVFVLIEWQFLSEAKWIYLFFPTWFLS